MIARKHVSWYSKGHRGAANFREHFNKIDNAQAQREAIEAFFI
jgi:tRNA-dihydrouridine synthase B